MAWGRKITDFDASPKTSLPSKSVILLTAFLYSYRSMVMPRCIHDRYRQLENNDKYRVQITVGI